MQFRQEKMIGYALRTYVNRTPVQKLVSKILYVENVPVSEMPVHTEADKINTLIDLNHRLTKHEFARKLNLSNSIVHDEAFIHCKKVFIWTKKKDEATFRATKCINFWSRHKLKKKYINN